MYLWSDGWVFDSSRVMLRLLSWKKSFFFALLTSLPNAIIRKEYKQTKYDFSLLKIHRCRLLFSKREESHYLQTTSAVYCFVYNKEPIESFLTGDILPSTIQRIKLFDVTMLLVAIIGSTEYVIVQPLFSSLPALCMGKIQNLHITLSKMCK